MKNDSIRLVTVTLSLAASLLVTTVAHAAKSRVVVLHTNDTHTHIDDGRVAFSEIAAEKARLEAAGENVILVDAGDYVQGTALGGFDSGRSAIDIMNAAGYRVATLGNHEFDYGIKTMFANAARATFQTVSCNFIGRSSADDPGRLVFPAYTVVTCGTTRVAFVGVTTPTTLVSAKPSTFLDPTRTYRAYDFIAGAHGADLYRAVQDAVNEAAAHADYTIVLGHLGISPDCADYMSTDVIAHTTNFVALVDGHSHSEYTGSRVRNAAGKEVILTQSGSYLGLLGCLVFEDGQCVMAGTIYTRGEKDAKVARLEKDLADAVERQLGEKIARAPVTLCSYRPGTNERLARKQGCSAGDFAADAVLWYANEKAGLACDFAMMNGGNVPGPRRARVRRAGGRRRRVRRLPPGRGALVHGGRDRQDERARGRHGHLDLRPVERRLPREGREGVRPQEGRVRAARPERRLPHRGQRLHVRGGRRRLRHVPQREEDRERPRDGLPRPVRIHEGVPPRHGRHARHLLGRRAVRHLRELPAQLRKPGRLRPHHDQGPPLAAERKGEAVREDRTLGRRGDDRESRAGHEIIFADFLFCHCPMA